MHLRIEAKVHEISQTKIVTSSLKAIKIHWLFSSLQNRVVSALGEIWRNVLVTAIRTGETSAQALCKAGVPLQDFDFAIPLKKQ